MKLSARNSLCLPSIVDLEVQEFEPEVLPLDWLCGGETRSAPLTGIKALMQAVLEDGVRCYLSAEQRIRSEAESWIASAGRGSPFAFRVVCETLGLEPAAVRLALKRMQQKELTPRQALGRTRPNVRRAARLVVRRVA